MMSCGRINGSVARAASLDDALAAWYKDKYGTSEAETRRRIALQRKMADAAQAAPPGLGSNFAGVWFDHGTGKVKIGRVKGTDPRSSRAVARESGIDDEDVDHAETSFAWGDLVRQQQFVHQDQDVSRLLRAAKVQLSIRPSVNAVIVFVSAEAAQVDKDRVRRVAEQAPTRVLVEERPASEFVVEPHQCVWQRFRSRCNRPLRGAVSLYAVGSTLGNGDCSMGGFATRPDGTGRFVMTAGHCLRTRGEWAAEHQSTGTRRAIGLAGGFNYGTANPGGGRTRDSGAINVYSSSFWSIAAESFVDNFDEHYPTVAVRPSPERLGICRIGQATPNNVGAGNCGEVTDVNFTVTYRDGNTLTDMTRATYCGAGGDSGGPVLGANVLYGIHSGGGECISYYEDAPRVEDDHGVRFATR
jgi:hypothetical protein